MVPPLPPPSDDDDDDDSINNLVGMGIISLSYSNVPSNTSPSSFSSSSFLLVIVVGVVSTVSARWSVL